MTMNKYHVTVKQVIIYDCFREAPDAYTAGVMALDNTLDDWEEDTEASWVETGEITLVTPEPDDSISWGELAELTHLTQVERFGFCSCEEQEEFPYEDCPRGGQ